MYVEAKSWKCRPSELAGLPAGSLEAYCFDSAVSSFGAPLMQELEAVEGKTRQAVEAKQQRILNKWIPSTGARAEQRFRQPVAGTH